MPALEEQKPASRMKRFPRQSGTTGLSVHAGRRACAGTRSIVLNVPSTWRGSKQGLGCTCVCVAQGGPGLARSRLQTKSGGLTSELQNVGCRWPGKITQASLNTAYMSLYHLDFLFIFKNNNFLKKWRKAGTRETATCRTVHGHQDAIRSLQNTFGSNYPNPTGPKTGLAILS